MIQYSLRCSQGHQFDAWFKNAQAFESQKANGHVACAICGDDAVDKALMAPAVARTDAPKRAVTAGHPDAETFRAMLRAYRAKVMSEGHYVGDRFAEEARRMHFEETEQRGIYGEATREEVMGLVEDGIEFMPLPDLPEEHN